MKRLKLIAAAALLGLPLAACDEATPPAPTGSIGGQVAVEGKGIDGVSVNLSNGGSTTTSDGGNFRFEGVEGGAYTVTISGYPADATFDRTSAAAAISAAGQSVTVNFSGTYVRTASVVGAVTVEGAGVSGVAVTLSGGPEDAATATTDGSGRYAFTGLRAGSYAVEISGFDNEEVGFSATAQNVAVAVGESKVVSFDGTYLRTAGVQGRVSVEGEGVEGVTVSLSGGPANSDMTTTTDAGGQYAFAKLRAGEYRVGISGYDADEYEFEATSRSVTVALGETANVPFEGVLLQTAGVSGRVSVEGTGLAGVTVSLSGPESETKTTDAGGQYAFAGLAAGTYAVAISGYDAAAYEFESDTMPASVLDGEAKIVNFDGRHARTASVSGRLYLDSNEMNDMYDAGAEDFFMHAGFPVALQGPGVNDVRTGATDSTGAYEFAGLRAGTYRVVPNATDSVRARLEKAGLAYNGDLTGTTVEVAAGASGMVHVPIDIVRQTITFGAVTGNGKTGKDAKTGGPVAGVMLKLYATYQDATADANELCDMVTDSTGMVEFDFARKDDADMFVFAKVTGMPAGYALTSNETMEIRYGSRKQVHAAGTPVTLVNTKVTLQFKAMSIKTKRGGGKALAGWKSSYVVGKDTAAFGTSDAKGMAKLAFTTPADSLPRTYTVLLNAKQDSAGTEKFEAARMPSDMADAGATSLSYTHDGLSTSAATVDLGMYEVKFTTQALVVGTHWERDQQEGYTKNLLGGDMLGTKGAVMIELLAPDSRGRLRRYEVKDAAHDLNKNGNPRATGTDGTVIFRNLPTEVEFTVEATAARGGRKIVGSDEADAYGDHLDSRSVGAFGAEGGTGPGVWLCPLGMDGGDVGEGCSTFAYLWANNVVWGSVGSVEYGAAAPTAVQSPARPVGCTGNAKLNVEDYRQCYREDQFPDVEANGLTVTLVPNSGDLEPANTMTATVGGTWNARNRSWSDSGMYEFRNVPSGRYTVVVGRTDDWQQFSPARTETFHLYQAVDRDTTVVAGNTAMHRVARHHPFRVKYRKTSIAGFVGNNQDGGAELTADEVMPGVKVSLLEGTKGSKVAAAAATDSRGAYRFDNVVEGTYRVRGESGDDHRIFGPTTYGGTPVAYKTTNVTDTIITTAQTANRRRDGTTNRNNNGLPRWLYTGGVTQPLTHLTNGVNNSKLHLVLLRRNGQINGRTYLTNSARTTRDYKDSIQMWLDPCRVPIWGGGKPTGCRPGQLGARIVTMSKTVTAGGQSTKGFFEFTGLLEGVYRLTAVVPNNFTIHPQTPNDEWVLVSFHGGRYYTSLDFAWTP